MAMRVGLLLLLPVIAAAIYLEGQSYDPDALDIKSAPGSELSPYLPAKAADFLRVGQTRYYGKDNLFEHVNGHAEFFISAGFKSLAVAGYKAPDKTDDMPDYTVDIYDMGDFQNSFGVYTGEGDSGEPLDVGYMGRVSGETATFINGPYYVKITSFGDTAGLGKLASEISALMGDLETKLPQFAKFPKQGSMATGKRFIKSDYMGVGFLSGVFEQKYRRGGEEFFAFLLTPREGPEKFFDKTRKFFKDMGVEVAQMDIGGAKAYEIRDEYEGTWAVIKSGDDIIGVRGLDDVSERLKFLREAVKGSG